MRLTKTLSTACLLLSLAQVSGQVSERVRTTRPVIRGRDYAVVSMKPQATQVAERILRAGGNAFDAAVAGQAVLGLVDFGANGVGPSRVRRRGHTKVRPCTPDNGERSSC